MSAGGRAACWQVPAPTVWPVVALRLEGWQPGGCPGANRGQALPLTGPVLGCSLEEEQDAGEGVPSMPHQAPSSPTVQILRHFEASCRQHCPAQRPLFEPGPETPCVGPSDLLTDAVPFAGGQAFLQPLTSTLLSPKAPPAPPPLDESPLPALGDTMEVETRLAGSEDQEARSEQGPAHMNTPHGGPELGPGPSSCLWSPVASDSHNSLFAGMELVACPHLVEAGTAEEEPPHPPWALSQRVAAPECPGSEVSAFAFLNS